LLSGAQHPLAHSLPVVQLNAQAWMPPEYRTHVESEQQLFGSGQ